MTDRQRFWLKVVLVVTLPVWILPAVALYLVIGGGLLVWASVSDMVDGVVE